MKISPIGHQTIARNSQNFKGLWGKTKTTLGQDNGIGIPTVTQTFYYYPFRNENPQQIEQTINSNQTEFIDDKNGKEKLITHICKRCMTLPFDENRYNNAYRKYYSGSVISDELKSIHRYAKDLYLDNAYNKQTPAINPFIEQDNI